MRPALRTYMEKFRATADDVFARTPYRSVVLTVAQYWADEANDAVHSFLVASMRDIPVWPHRCPGMSEEVTEVVPGEACRSCSRDVFTYRLNWWDDNGDAVGFEAWCHEGGSQDHDPSYNALPVLLARRDETGVRRIGAIQRIASLLYDRTDEEDAVPARAQPEGEPDPAWDDPRALALLDQTVDDDHARRVLADYLLERNLLRGELLATATDARARHDELMFAHFSTWFHPLSEVSPAATAVFDRGLLAECDVCATFPDQYGVMDAPVLRTVHTVRVHGGDYMLSPSMRALRTLGPVDAAWLELLVREEAWNIERLHAIVNDAAAIDLLGSATNLPRLRELTLSGHALELATTELQAAAWWSQLQRLVIVDRDVDAVATWAVRYRTLGVPWLAIQVAYTSPVDGVGWEIAIGPHGTSEATLRGFVPQATFEELARLAVQAPQRPTLVASEFYAPAARDLKL